MSDTAEMNETMGLTIPQVPLERELEKSYLDYSMSVIVGRALPDVRDGLKPVQRRIIWTMYRMGLLPPPDKKRKSATIVGETIGKYHPHGEQAVYDALVRMAQDFTMRYPLVNGQGNFGSLDGLPPAAYRYTEAGLTPITAALVADIDKETVPFIPNFDGEEQEPTVLPTRLPNLLINGTIGIAVGMATSIPPHNLSEVIDGIIALLENPDLTSAALMNYIKGPDFPSGGYIIGTEGIKQAYESGRGKVILRGKAEVAHDENEGIYIHVSDLPYQIKRQDYDTKNARGFVNQVEELMRRGRFPEISRIENLSSKRGVAKRRGNRRSRSRTNTDGDQHLESYTGTDIRIYLRPGTNPQVVLNKLYRYTKLQTSISIISMALIPVRHATFDPTTGETIEQEKLVPRILTLKAMLQHFINHRKTVIRRRSQYELRESRKKAHILEGRLKALQDIDRLIELIRAAEDTNTAKQSLMDEFELTETQATDILDRPLRILTKLDRDKIKEELKAIKENIAFLEELLQSDTKIKEVIKEELLEVKEKYGDERRTIIISGNRAQNELDHLDNETALIQERPIVIPFTNQGFIESRPLDVYAKQHRGGKGSLVTYLRENDFIKDLIVCSNLDNILVLANSGKAYAFKAHQIPISHKKGKKTYHINQILRTTDESEITEIIPIPKFEPHKDLIVATKRGKVVRISLTEFENLRQTGKKAVTLREEDNLIGAIVASSEQDEIVLVTKKGRVSRIKVGDIRKTRCGSQGVIGMRIRKGDEVVAMALVRPSEYLLTCTKNGYGNRVKFDSIRCKRRGAKGVRLITTGARNGPVVASKTVKEDSQVIMVTKKGKLIRMTAGEVRLTNRATKGVRLIRLDSDDEVKAMALIRSDIMARDSAEAIQNITTDIETRDVPTDEEE